MHIYKELSFVGDKPAFDEFKRIAPSFASGGSTQNLIVCVTILHSTTSEKKWIKLKCLFTMALIHGEQEFSK